MAKLLKVYSSHCVRPTYITQLKDAGFSNEEVCVLSGHKDDRSINKYDKRRTDRNLHKISEVLIHGDEEITSTSTSSHFHNATVRASQNENSLKNSSAVFDNCTFQNCQVFVGNYEN